MNPENRRTLGIIGVVAAAAAFTVGAYAETHQDPSPRPLPAPISVHVSNNEAFESGYNKAREERSQQDSNFLMLELSGAVIGLLIYSGITREPVGN